MKHSCHDLRLTRLKLDILFQCDSKWLTHFEKPKVCCIVFQETWEHLRCKAFAGIRDQLGGADDLRNSGNPLALVSYYLQKIPYTEVAIAIESEENKEINKKDRG